MYWKKSKWIAFTTLSALWLAACSTDTDTAVKDSETNIEDSNEVNNPSNTVNHSITLEQAIEQTATTFAYIIDVFTEAGISHDPDNMTLSANIYEENKHAFSTYTTENYIENGLKAIAQQYCITCENQFIPQNPTCAFKTVLETVSIDEVRLISTYNRNSPTGQVREEIITFKLEDDVWKIDETTSETISLDLDIQSAALIFDFESFTNATFVEETMLSVEGGSEEVVYVFETDEGTYAITQNDGYIIQL